MRDTPPQTLQSLFGDAMRETSDLAQKEFALFRAEMAQNVRTMFMGLAMIVVAAVFAIGSIVLLTDALVKWLATVVGSDALASLIVGVALAVIAVALALYGRSSIAAFTLAPKRTVRSIKRDSQVLAERVSG